MEAIFPIILLMVAKNVRSIEALKDIRLGEAGLVLGIRKIPGKAKVWEMFYLAAEMKKSSLMIKTYFKVDLREPSPFGNIEIEEGLPSFWTQS